MKYPKILQRCTTVLLGISMLLTGCATQLVPLYDKAIVDGLTTVNVETMALLASASGGTSRETFQDREFRYNRVIGSLDALSLQTQARPAPTNTSIIVKKIVAKHNLMDSEEEMSSAIALEKISETITKMRDTDRKQGLTATEVQAFKGNVKILMDQALTYESALER